MLRSRRIPELIARIIGLKGLEPTRRWAAIDLETEAVFILSEAGSTIVIVTVIRLRPGQTTAARRAVADPV